MHSVTGDDARFIPTPVLEDLTFQRPPLIRAAPSAVRPGFPSLPPTFTSLLQAWKREHDSDLIRHLLATGTSQKHFLNFFKLLSFISSQRRSDMKPGTMAAQLEEQQLCSQKASFDHAGPLLYSGSIKVYSGRNEERKK